MTKKGIELELKVGLFLSIGAVLIMLAILLLGGAQSFFTSQVQYSAHFSNTEGLITGAKVLLNGIPVGTVTNVRFDDRERDIAVEMTLQEKYQDWIRNDSTAEIATQGVLGDKYISITGGSPGETILPPGSQIPAKNAGSLSSIISDSGKLMVSLTSIASSLDRMLQTFEKANRSDMFFEGIAKTAKNLSSISEKVDRQLDDIKLKESIAHLNSILKKIDHGKGTVGAFINDPALYDDVKLLIGGANRNRVLRNLVRKTIKDREEEASAVTK